MARGLGHARQVEQDDGAGPAVRHDQRQGIGVTRTHMYELNVESLDRCNELRQGIQLRLGLPPVVVSSPVAHECLDLRQLHALGLISDRLPIWPTCREYSSAKVHKFRFRNVDAKGTDCGSGVVSYGHTVELGLGDLRLGYGGLLLDGLLLGNGLCVGGGKAINVLGIRNSRMSSNVLFFMIDLRSPVTCDYSLNGEYSKIIRRRRRAYSQAQSARQHHGLRHILGRRKGHLITPPPTFALR